MNIEKAHDSIMNSVDSQLRIYKIDRWNMEDEEAKELYDEMSRKLAQFLRQATLGE